MEITKNTESSFGSTTEGMMKPITEGAYKPTVTPKPRKKPIIPAFFRPGAKNLVLGILEFTP